MEMVHRNVGPQREGYQASTRFTKMDLPRFTRDDVAGRISKCEGYFDLDKMPKAHKVTRTSLALDEMGYLWFEGLKIQFCTVLRRPLEELMELKQSGKLSDYQERFKRISCRLDLSETHKFDCYLRGLKPKIAWDVRLFNPRTQFRL